MACDDLQATVDEAQAAKAACEADLAVKTVAKQQADDAYQSSLSNYMQALMTLALAQQALLDCQQGGGGPGGAPKKMQPVKPDPDDELAQARETARQLADAIARMEAARREQPAA